MISLCRFSQGLRLRQIDMIQDGVAGSSRTLSKMSEKLRKVCKDAVKRQKRRGKQKLGGTAEFVVIDESNFCHKRKVCIKHWSPTCESLGSLPQHKQNNEITFQEPCSSSKHELCCVHMESSKWQTDSMLALSCTARGS